MQDKTDQPDAVTALTEVQILEAIIQEKRAARAAKSKAISDALAAALARAAAPGGSDEAAVLETVKRVGYRMQAPSLARACAIPTKRAMSAIARLVERDVVGGTSILGNRAAQKPRTGVICIPEVAVAV